MESNFPRSIDDIKISLNLEWLRPYLKKAYAKEKIPLPGGIRSTKPNFITIQRTKGACYVERKLIVLSTNEQRLKKLNSGYYGIERIMRVKKLKLLKLLAHELTHLVYNDHSSKHYELANRIFNSFKLVEKCLFCKGKGKIPARY